MKLEKFIVSRLVNPKHIHGGNDDPIDTLTQTNNGNQGQGACKQTSRVWEQND